MKLSTIRKLSIELLPDDVRKWMEPIVQVLNWFLDQVVRALTNQLTLADNLKAQKFTITLDASQAYPLKLAYMLNEKPTMVLVGQIQTQDGSAVAAHTFTWQLVNSSLEITITGLATTKHSITIVAQV